MFKPEKLEEIPNFLTRYAECHVDELAAAEDVVFDAIRRIEAAEQRIKELESQAHNRGQADDYIEKLARR